MIIEFLQGILNPVQLIGYVGTACALTSYQCKKNRNYFLLQMGCAIAFTVQFLLLGSFAGMLLNLFSILRGVVFAMGDKCKKTFYLVIMELCFALSCIAAPLFFGEKWWIATLVIMAAALFVNRYSTEVYNFFNRSKAANDNYYLWVGRISKAIFIIGMIYLIIPL
jgi:hypothetical protein